MSSTPLYSTLKASSAVTVLLGATPRVYAFGQAPTAVVKPYLVWQVISGSPENNLGQSPEFDFLSLQLDVYGDTEDSATAVKLAVRDAIEPVMHITSWDGESRDKETNLYRITFSVDWFVNR
jgi:hypothetical protein